MKIAVLLGLALAFAPAPALAEISAGMLVPATPGAEVDGWTVDNAGVDNNNEFYLTLKKGRAYTLAWIDPLGNVAQGTEDQVQLLAVASTVTLKGETAVDGPNCLNGTQQPILAFFNGATGMARGYFVEEDAIVLKRWKTTRAQCQPVGS